ENNEEAKQISREKFKTYSRRGREPGTFKL
ncbi:DNA polymerase III subunit chi, partial [Acinetobacter baumannii]